MAELNRAEWKPKFFSEYSMGELDFNRFNDWLKFIERYSGEINSTDLPNLEQCQCYFAGINVLWKLWRPIIGLKPVTEDVDKAIKEAKRLKRKWERNSKQGFPINRSTILELVDKLDELHTKLMEIKQIIGLGIKIYKNLSIKQKIRAGIKGYSGKRGEILPDA